ncbi:unnamed protein product [Nippostrongylus brasiliensis]|uniref:Alpha-methylacyl-CoA racemase (inferred by orthology to a human protein) n=1 Tax=Nippostrongylus brasiliensis TaxID=27835 RepID=A0A0N4Y888_NIPBR|nr:unnamed protein product [Nippostrongylus brasiliensis]
MVFAGKQRTGCVSANRLRSTAFGVVAALLKREKNGADLQFHVLPVVYFFTNPVYYKGGHGCIIDCSMSEGLSYLGSFVRRYYDMEHLTYKAKDDKWVAVGALEPKFNTTLFTVLGMDISISDMYSDPAGVESKMEEIFRRKTRDEWMSLFAESDACVTPVLSLDEAIKDPHNVARESFTKDGNTFVPQPAPKMYSGEEFRKLTSKL